MATHIIFFTSTPRFSSVGKRQSGAESGAAHKIGLPGLFIGSVCLRLLARTEPTQGIPCMPVMATPLVEKVHLSTRGGSLKKRPVCLRGRLDHDVLLGNDHEGK